MQYDLLGTESYFVVMARRTIRWPPNLSLTAAEIRHAQNELPTALVIAYNLQGQTALYSPNTIFVKNLGPTRWEIIKSHRLQLPR